MQPFAWLPLFRSWLCHLVSYSSDPSHPQCFHLSHRQCFPLSNCHNSSRFCGWNLMYTLSDNKDGLNLSISLRSKLDAHTSRLYKKARHRGRVSSTWRYNLKRMMMAIVLVVTWMAVNTMATIATAVRPPAPPRGRLCGVPYLLLFAFAPCLMFLPLP